MKQQPCKALIDNLFIDAITDKKLLTGLTWCGRKAINENKSIYEIIIQVSRDYEASKK